VGVVNQQSEHLSNAQIENYGDRSSGEGPEQDQHDEERWVEAHLADCSSCRSRVLDFQRTHLFRNSELAGPGTGDRMVPDLKPGNPNPRDPRLPADAQASTASTPDCPNKEDIRLLAAGLCSDATATRLTQHAASCDHCGALLRGFVEDFSDDFSPEEQAMLDQLASNSEAWQIKTAREMARAGAVGPVGAVGTAATTDDIRLAEARLPLNTPSVKKRGRKPFFWRWVLVPVAAVIVMIATIATRRDTPEKVERLLAQAYTERRNLEMRVPYASHADYKQKRSDDTESRLNSPPSLNTATDKISKQLEKAPDDPRWLMLSARLDLLDWGYKPALSTLDKISDPQVIESPEFLMTRSLALYEKSEALKESQGYYEAVNLLAKALQKTPDDPVLLFNQAIACERIHSYKCANEDWTRLLAVEKDPHWSAEAHKHLNTINEKKSLAP